jgi:hypothetical protein
MLLAGATAEGRGTGLGLSQVYGFARQCGGGIPAARLDPESPPTGFFFSANGC